MKPQEAHMPENEELMNQEQKLLDIQEGIRKYFPWLSKAWDSILDSQVSDYPIAIFSTLPIETGVLFMDRDNAPGPWSLSFSALEEFHVKGLINEDKIEDFQKIYKDPEEFYCAFVISDLGAQFLFIPR